MGHSDIHASGCAVGWEELKAGQWGWCDWRGDLCDHVLFSERRNLSLPLFILCILPLKRVWFFCRYLVKNSLDPHSSQNISPHRQRWCHCMCPQGLLSIWWGVETRWKSCFLASSVLFNKIKPHLLRRGLIALLSAWFNLGVIPPPEALWWLSYSGMHHWEHRGVQEFDVELVVNTSEVWDLEYSFTNAGFYSAHTLPLHIYMIYMYMFGSTQLLSLLLLFVLFLLFFGGPINFLIDLCVVSFLSTFWFVYLCSCTVVVYPSALQIQSAVTAILVKVRLKVRVKL